MISKLFAATAVALALSQVGAAQAAIVADGAFTQGSSAGSFSTIGAGQTIGAWTVTGNSVDLIGSYWEATPNGGHTIDLDGNGAGGISQSVTLADGEYQLSFYLGGNPDGGPATKDLNVSIDGITVPYSFTNSGQTHGNMGYQLETFDFTITSPTTTTLSFSSTDAAGNPWGPVVGEVSISAIPEPSSMALLLAGIGLVGTVARRRNRAQ
jgi:choice-of-anchor C domain-containing protein